MTLNHTRNVSTSSDETLVWSPSSPPTSAPPALPQLDQDLQRAAERVFRQKQADEIRRLRQVVSELTSEKDSETQRAEGLKTDLAVSEANRQANLDMAIQYYKKQGNPFLVELENLSERVEEMRREIESRDNLILDRDAIIDALERDVSFYADRDHWMLMQQRYYELQQRYEQMPADLRSLERRYGFLQDDYDDLSGSFRDLEANLTVLRAELRQVEDERDQLEYEASTAEQQSANAVSRYREIKVERDQILVQKAESEEQAGARERLLADLASRMFNRTIIMASMLDEVASVRDGIEVEIVDNEFLSLCQLANEHLGIDAKEIYKAFEVARAREKRDREAEECDERGVPEADAGNSSSSATAAYSDKQEPNIRLAGSNGVESPNTYDARRRREVAAAEEAILGPLGLGFEDGSPTLKTIPRSSKPSRVTGLVLTSPETPSKTRRGLFASGADEIDQVTPARTGGTGGIARDQWQIAADDLQELTEAFRGPRMQPVDVVLQEATEVEEEGGRGDGEDAPSNREGDACLSPNGDVGHEDDLVGEAAVERDPIVSSSSRKMPLAEGSRVFQDLGMGNKNVQQEADAVPDLPKEAFNAPKFEDFKFGGGSGAIAFTESENKSLALTEETPASTATGIFKLSSASTQAPMNADDPPSFEQDFNFSGSNGAVSFTACQNAPASLPTSGPELESAAAFSVPGTSLVEESPAVIAEANDELPNETASEVIGDGSKADALSANTQKSKKAEAKAKKAQEKARKTEERKEAAFKAKGPNRDQRRAASRERKAKEKKAQAEAKKAQSGTTKAADRRRAVATAMMRA